jgi:radical SAM superfamily enzyme YgiQ (UPF0313 family)
MTRIVLISTYDLGRSPVGLASPAAWLRRAGHDVRCCDLAVEPLDEAAVRAAELIAFHLPMHTATRLALRAIPRVRRLAPEAVLCAYGLYAAMNAESLRAAGVRHLFSGEFEGELVALARAPREIGPRVVTSLERLDFVVPDRSDLPPLDHYARLRVGEEERLVANVEATRGCKHLCRHCPVVPVYGGRFRAVPREVVLEDVRRQVAMGAQHVTFGDPDFWNGIGHAMPLVRALHAEFPNLSYDVTIKVEHLLKHAEHLPALRETGCALVTSAVEAVDDRILAKLDKGHTRADFERALGLCRAAGLELQPTFVAFTPWTSLEGYAAMLEAIETLDLVDHVAPIQLALRLLVTAGSRLLELDDVRGWIEGFDPERLVHRWRHPDRQVDALQQKVQAEVERRLAAGDGRRAIFEAVAEIAGERAFATRGPREARVPALSARRAPVPYLTEPWYC